MRRHLSNLRGEARDRCLNRGTGYAIGLSPVLFQPDKDDLYEEANKNLHIGRVVYGDRATPERHELSVRAAADITSRVGWAHSRLARETGLATYLRVMAHELLASQMIWNCLTGKEAQFEDERQVRRIVMNVREKFDSWRRSHAGRHYVEHALPLQEPGSITEILVGPDAPVDAEARVQGGTEGRWSSGNHSGAARACGDLAMTP
jgi:hypothetical protein